ncbi:ECF transporter S component [Paenibacillus sp. WQ 127069]|jgi:energy-coupling factor transport system substrate-specific component|uniref:ECF transporter S component n=1 Tax=Paenibacillus baimaensis TaxID=2982185 RepID=A0ABT2UPQ2_9BACL|nr:ECF transporter S component [Paenibacillus sp. WQ 127069]MCU6796623.1 ECF transporter S component [Paenibacillus sp. WQ 127069]
MSKGLKLTDILVTVVISVVFAIIYRLWGDVSNVVKLAGFQLDQLMYGVWFMAAVVAFLIIRKPGVALLAEIAAASGELIAGSQYGVEALTYGIAQGLGAELIFLLFAYRRFSVTAACLAGVASAIASLVFDAFKGYLLDLESWNLILYFVFRIIGSIFFTGLCSYGLVKALEATGVTQLVRPASQADFDALERKQ